MTFDDDAGFVSAWIGHAASSDVLDAAVSSTYTEDGDSLGSPFGRAFTIEHYDSAAREARYLERPAQSLEELLSGASYEDVVVPRLSACASSPVEGNCVVLLYDCRHDGPTRWDSEQLALRYVGTVRYR